MRIWLRQPGHLIVSEAAAEVDEPQACPPIDSCQVAFPETVSARSRISQTAACGSSSPWMIIFVYVSTREARSIKLSLQADGSISLLNGAASNTSVGSRPIDMALSRDGQ